MAIPQRLNSVRPLQTFFVTTCTWQKQNLFQSEQMAQLFLRCLFEYRDNKKFSVHAFVLMPDHFHIILTPAADMTLERCMQLIKGGFSFRVKKELGKTLEVWQKGFNDRRVRNQLELSAFVEYIRENPAKAGFATSYPYSSDESKFQLDDVPDYLSG